MDHTRSAGWKDEYLKMVEDCRKRDHMLSAWDADFLDSIESRIEAGHQLTLKQTNKLDEIWEKATSNG